MKFSTATVLSLCAALGAAAPAPMETAAGQFLFAVTARGQTQYLGRGGKAVSRSQALKCSQSGAQILCGGQPIGVDTSLKDMAILSAGTHKVNSGFNVSPAGEISWKNAAFGKTKGVAHFGLGVRNSVWVDLGCDETGIKNAHTHGALTMGSAKAVPV